MKTFILGAHPKARGLAIAAVQNAPDGYAVTIKEATRSSEQSAKMWAMLNEIADSVDWHGRKLDSTSWKHIFTSSLRKLDVVPNLDGTGFVALGLSTSKMTKAEMGDLLTLIEMFGAQHNVKFKEN